MITPLLKKIFIKCSLRPPKKDFWRRKTFVFLVSFLTVQKRPIEWLVQTLLVRHFPRLARLSGVMTQSGFLPWLPARNSGFFYWKQQASCRDLQKRSWCLFSFISMTMTTLPRKVCSLLVILGFLITKLTWSIYRLFDPNKLCYFTVKPFGSLSSQHLYSQREKRVIFMKFYGKKKRTSLGKSPFQSQTY